VVAVGQANDTGYTANIADGEGRGTVSVINGVICNGTDHHGCSAGLPSSAVWVKTSTTDVSIHS
jgi:hypothetical protein